MRAFVLSLRRFAVVHLAAASFAMAACSDPTLQEACAEYCAAIEEADCPNTPPNCDAQCDQIEAQLDGKCVEEYTEALDCAAGEDFECQDGNAVVTSQGCLDEALTVLECQGVLTEDD